MFFNPRFRLVIFFLSAVILGFTGITQAQTTISTCSELQNIANNPSAAFALANDVDCTVSAGWNSGAGFAPINNFTGMLDGQGHTILNLTINRPTQNQAGLFASIVNGGQVKDLTLSNAQITGQSQVGVLGGYMFLASVSNISVTGSHVTGTSRAGGLLGESYNGNGIFKADLENVTVNGSGEVGGLVGRIWDGNDNKIVQSSVKATVVGTGDSVGGIAGYSKSGDFIESFSEGSVQGNNNVGGIAGYTFENAGIHNSYSKNSVTGNQNVGGVAGLFDSYDDGVSNTYFAGTVTGNSTAGGFLGTYSRGIISSNYWDVTKNPSLPGVGNGDKPEITGKTTAQMFAQSTYTGWDFVNIWAINGDYPILLHLPTSNSNLISNCIDLQNIIYNPSGTYTLVNDVDCSASASWNAGAGFLPINNFTGTFDGQGHTISNLTINRPTQNQAGLFASLLNNGYVKDLTLSNAQITGQSQTGVLTGYMFLAHVSNISVAGSHVNGTSRVGGLIGESYNGTGILKADLESVTVNGSSEVGGLVGRIWDGNDNKIVQSSVKTTVVGTGDSVGGIAGYSKSGDFIESFSEGSVQGNNNVGGIAGYTFENAGILNSYSKNSVTGNQNVGGVAGLFDSYDDGVSNTYFAGTVTGNSTAGGFLGTYSRGTISSNYWDMTKNPSLPGVGNGDKPEITGKTTAEMFVQSTYTGWNFVNIWRINGNYPELRFYPSYLIKDGFETGNFNNWASWSVPNYQCGLSVEPQAAYEGQYGLHISSPGAASSYCRVFQTFPYHQENLYAEVQARQRNNWADGSRAFARIEFWSSNPPNGSVVEAVDCVPDITQPGQPWTHCIINSASHSWAPYMRLVLSVDNSDTASAPSHADFDNVRFKPIDINLNAGRNVVFTDKNSNSSLNFNEVTESGYAEIAPSNSGPQLPTGYALVGNYTDIITTANFSGPVTVCLGYDDSGLTLQDEQSLRLNHYENGVWVDITTVNDTTGNTVCGEANSFSPFAIFIKEKRTVDLFLHGSGANANPSSLFLNAIAPTSTIEKYRDSVDINDKEGNPWRAVGTWIASSNLSNGTLTELNNVHAWIGLKSSNEQKIRFDMKTELLRNGAVVASGETYCIQGETKNSGLANEVIVPFAPFSPIGFNGTDDKLSLRILTRVGTNGSGGTCGGQSNSGKLRVYFDAVSRPSKFQATFQ